MIELKQLEVAYGDTPALRGIDLSIGEGRTTVLIGPSGSGKTTLLATMIGLVPLRSGTVTIDGERLAASAAESARLLRRRMGYVVQDGGLFPHMTAARNVGLMAARSGWSAQRIAARTTTLAQLVDLPIALLQRYPDELSGGQRQRVALARALMLEPQLLLLDEPMGGLDPMIRAELQRDLRRIFQELDRTVVLVTHDLAEAAFLGDHIVLLRDGRIAQQGSIEELVAAPASDFVRDFLAAQRSPPVLARSEG